MWFTIRNICSGILDYSLIVWVDDCRGNKINYSVAGSGKPLILVHGFGKYLSLCSTFHKANLTCNVMYPFNQKPINAQGNCGEIIHNPGLKSAELLFTIYPGHNIQRLLSGKSWWWVNVCHVAGGNVGHFARLIPFVAENYRVYAIDLLGFGDSDKPTNVEYGPELWADLVCGVSLFPLTF